jgi:integrase
MQLKLDLKIESTLENLILEETKLRLECRAALTRRGYAYDWKAFETWCRSVNRPSFPATIQTVCSFVTDQLARGYKVSSTQRRLQGVLHTLREQGFPLDPQANYAKMILSGAQRLRCEQPRQMTPLTPEHIAAISGKLIAEGTPYAIRNRCIIALGFASALRRSTLSMLTLSDITFSSAGMLIRVRKEKQDQEGKGRVIPIPGGTGLGCPCAALKAWIAIRTTAPGPLFVRLDPQHRGKLCAMTSDTVWRTVKASVQKIGLDPKSYGSHSLRAGFITEALSRGIGEVRVANHSGHRSLDTLRRYFRPVDPFRTAIGL